MNPIQKGQEVLKAMLGNKIGKWPPYPSTAASVGLASGCLRGEGDQLQGSALGIGLGYSLPLSMVFVLCIIYCREASKPICHHIIGHRDP